MQTKKHSFAETITQTVSGYIVSLAMQVIVFPHFDIHISFVQNIQISIWFTIAAIIKGYYIRRWWNRHATKHASNQILLDE